MDLKIPKVLEREGSTSSQGETVERERRPFNLSPIQSYGCRRGYSIWIPLLTTDTWKSVTGKVEKTINTILPLLSSLVLPLLISI